MHIIIKKKRKIAQINTLIKCNHTRKYIIINCTDKHSYSSQKNTKVIEFTDKHTDVMH